MDTLPVEILTLVLKWAVRMSKCEKNDILPLRRVCKVFDVILKPYALKTLQLEFSRFLRHAPKPDPGSLLHAGAVCEAIYLDMMVVRDEGTSNTEALSSQSLLRMLGVPSYNLRLPNAYQLLFLMR